MKKFLAAATVMTLASTSVLAGEKEIWQGKGEVRSMDNVVQKSYTVTVTREGKALDTVTQHVDVTASDGKKLYQDDCEIVYNADHAWKKACSKSQGGGYMMNYGIGQDYVYDSEGRAFATIIILDGANDMRLERVELLNGKAQRLFVETLHKGG